jgi:hypothetical protein
MDELAHVAPRPGPPAHGRDAGVVNGYEKNLIGKRSFRRVLKPEIVKFILQGFGDGKLHIRQTRHQEGETEAEKGIKPNLFQKGSLLKKDEVQLLKKV